MKLWAPQNVKFLNILWTSSLPRTLLHGVSKLTLLTLSCSLVRVKLHSDTVYIWYTAVNIIRVTELRRIKCVGHIASVQKIGKQQTQERVKYSVLVLLCRNSELYY
jgi:hypothetical protein